MPQNQPSLLTTLLERIKLETALGTRPGAIATNALLGFAPEERERLRPAAEMAAGEAIANELTNQEDLSEDTDCELLHDALLTLEAAGYLVVRGDVGPACENLAEVEGRLVEALSRDEFVDSYVYILREDVLRALEDGGLIIRVGYAYEECAVGAIIEILRDEGEPNALVGLRTERARIGFESILVVKAEEAIQVLKNHGLKPAHAPSRSGLIWCPLFKWQVRRGADGEPLWEAAEEE